MGAIEIAAFWSVVIIFGLWWAISYGSSDEM